MHNPNDKQWAGNFFFLQMADCQLGFLDKEDWKADLELLEKAVALINELKPKFVVLCGDMTQDRPGEKNYKQQVADYKRTVAAINKDIPLICLCGNHDVGDHPSPSTIKEYEQNFGAHYFSFFIAGLHCIAVNSSLLKDPSNAPDLNVAQINWLRKELQEETEFTHRFVFTHHPWFLKDIEEEDSHFNMPIQMRKEWCTLFAEKKVTACFSGHYHANSCTKYKNMEMITTGAVGKPLFGDVSGLRKVTVSKEGISHEYIAL